jgi:hypothetical protein
MVYRVVRLSVWARVQTISFRIIKLGILDHHNKRKNAIVFQGQRSKVKVVALLKRKIL